jgi:NAD(P)-dependent dehydrogenase (short-subunit alcohol dehydrogenase family)
MSRTILITGATDGIGRQTAEELAATGAELILHGRSGDKLDAVRSALETIAGHGPLRSLVADLSDLDAVADLARELEAELGEGGRLDVLINNAGVYQNELRFGTQGHELTWTVNYLAPFLLSQLLLPLLRRSSEGRILNVSSIAHTRGRLRWQDFDMSQDYGAYAAYAQSKLALVMFTRELARRLDAAHTEEPVPVSLHPGVVSTKLLTEGFGMRGSDSLAEGAATSIHLAMLPIAELREHAGAYFVRKQVAAMSPTVHDDEARERLYDRSCALLEPWLKQPE